MNIIGSVFFLTVFFLIVTVAVAMDGQIATGCYMLGAEINGDYSTEYLYLGDCH
jgi:hypothetical protein